MLRHSPTENIGPTSRIIILVITALVTLGILIYMLMRPPGKPLQLEPPGPFGAPGATPTAESTGDTTHQLPTTSNPQPATSH